MKEKGVMDWIKSFIFLILAIPFLIIGAITVLILAILTGPNWKRCENWRVCPWYKGNSYTCNEDFGMAYGYNHTAGCFEEVEKRKEELNKKGKKLRRLR